MLAINPACLDVSSLQQFIDAARAKPGSIDVASAGLGTVPHLAIEMLQARGYADRSVRPRLSKREKIGILLSVLLK